MRVRFGCQRTKHRRADTQGNGLAHQRHTHRVGRGRSIGHGRVRAFRLPYVPPASQLSTRRSLLLQLVSVRLTPFGLFTSIPHHIHMADGHPGSVEVSLALEFII